MSTDATPSPAEFKFNCPLCGQHILVAAQWSGLVIGCPSCQGRITVPPPTGKEHGPAAVTPARRVGQTIRIELPVQAIKNSAATSPPATEAKARAAAVSGAGRAGDSERARVTEPWPDVVRRLEQGVPIAPAELATAVFEELTNVRRRLDALEGEHARDSQIRPAAKRGETGEDSCHRPRSSEMGHEDPHTRSPANPGPVSAETKLEVTSL
jgi:hypothetical protein